MAASEQVLRLLGDAKRLGPKDKEQRARLVDEAVELVTKKHPEVLTLPTVNRFLEFRSDTLPGVRRAVVAVLERAIRLDPAFLKSLHEPLQFLIYDRADTVQRRAVLALEACLKRVLRWLQQHPIQPGGQRGSGANGLPAEVTAAWRTIIQIKDRLMSDLDIGGTPDAVRSAIFQFAETWAYCFSMPPNERDLAAAAGGYAVAQPYRWDDAHVTVAGQFTLEDVPPGARGHPLLQKDVLSSDGRRAARKLIQLLSDNPSVRADGDGSGSSGSGSSSSGGSEVPYTAATYSDLLTRVSNLAYCRPDFMPEAAAAVSKFATSPPSDVIVSVPAPSNISGYSVNAKVLQPELIQPVRAAINRLLTCPASARYAPALNIALRTLQTAASLTAAAKATAANSGFSEVVATSAPSVGAGRSAGPVPGVSSSLLAAMMSADGHTIRPALLAAAAKPSTETGWGSSTEATSASTSSAPSSAVVASSGGGLLTSMMLTSAAGSAAPATASYHKLLSASISESSSSGASEKQGDGDSASASNAAEVGADMSPVPVSASGSGPLLPAPLLPTPPGTARGDGTAAEGKKQPPLLIAPVGSNVKLQPLLPAPILPASSGQPPLLPAPPPIVAPSSSASSTATSALRRVQQQTVVADLSSGNAYSLFELLALPEFDDVTSSDVSGKLVDLALQNLAFLPPENADFVAQLEKAVAAGAEPPLDRLLAAVLAVSEPVAPSPTAADAAVSAGGAGAAAAASGIAPLPPPHLHSAVQAWAAPLVASGSSQSEVPGNDSRTGFDWAACGTTASAAANEAVKRVSDVVLAQVNDSLLHAVADLDAEEARRKHRSVVTAAENSAEAVAKRAAARKAAQQAASFASIVRSCVGSQWADSMDRLIALLELAARSTNAVQLQQGSSPAADEGSAASPPAGGPSSDSAEAAKDAPEADPPAIAAEPSLVVAPLDIIAEALVPSPQMDEEGVDGEGAGDGGEGQQQRGQQSGKSAGPVPLSPSSLRRLHRILLLCAHRLWTAHVGLQTRQRQRAMAMAAAAVGGAPSDDAVDSVEQPVPADGTATRAGRKRPRSESNSSGEEDAKPSRRKARLNDGADAADASVAASDAAPVEEKDDGMNQEQLEEGGGGAAEGANEAPNAEAQQQQQLQSDPLGYYLFTPQCCDMLTSLILAATHKAADRMASAAAAAASSPGDHDALTAMTSASSALADLGGGELLSSFVLDVPSLPPVCLDLLTSVCAGHHPMAAAFRSSRAYDNAFGPAAIARKAAASKDPHALPASSTPEGIAVGAIRDVLLCRPMLRPAALDALLAIALADSSVDNARRLAQRVLAKRAMEVPGAGDYVVGFARACLRRLQAPSPASAASSTSPSGGKHEEAAEPDAAPATVEPAAMQDSAATHSAVDSEAKDERDAVMNEATATADDQDRSSVSRPDEHSRPSAPPAAAAAAVPLLTAGCDAGIGACFEVNDSLMQACGLTPPSQQQEGTEEGGEKAEAPTTSLAQRTALTSRLLQLWAALCTARPALLSELSSVFIRASINAAAAAAAAATSAAVAPHSSPDGKKAEPAAAAAVAAITSTVAAASPVIAALKTEAAPLLKALAKSLPGFHAGVLKQLLAPPEPDSMDEGDAALPSQQPQPSSSGFSISPVAAPFLQWALALLVDDAAELLAPAVVAAMEKEGAAAAGTIFAPAGRLLSMSPVLAELLSTARKVMMTSDSSGDDVIGDLPFSGYASFGDFLLAPFCGLLPPDQLRPLLERMFISGSVEAIRYVLSTRLFRTPRVAPSLPVEELGALLIEGGDLILAREVPLSDKLKLVGEITSLLFDRTPLPSSGQQVFTDVIMQGTLARTGDRAAQRVAASSASGSPPKQPALPLLFMKCALLQLHASPESRGAAVGLLGGLLKRCGGVLFEPVEPGLAKWSSEGNASAASVWDGFVRVLKAAIPLSFMLIPQLPEGHVKLLLSAKNEVVLRDRFRSWFGTWSGRDSCPRYVRDIIAALPPPANAAAPAGAAAKPAAAAAAATGAAGASGASAPAPASEAGGKPAAVAASAAAPSAGAPPSS